MDEITSDQDMIAEPEVGELREFLQYANALLQQTLTAVGGRLGQVRFEDEYVRQMTALDAELKEVGNQPMRVPLPYASLIKTAVLTFRRTIAEGVEAAVGQTHNPDMIRSIESRLAKIDKWLEKPWVREAGTIRIPQLTDYLTPELADQTLHGAGQLTGRTYDEKFHILFAPSLFLPDLKTYRMRCALRNAGVTAVYLDVDNFKGFNTQYGEVMVDRVVLPRLMREIESHVFLHGHAYRFGGDEYALVLPNLAGEFSLRFLDALRLRIAKLDYPGFERKATVSIGACTVFGDSHLTEREIEAAANRAKAHAKAQGKNRIAYYEGDAYQAEALRIYQPK